MTTPTTENPAIMTKSEHAKVQNVLSKMIRLNLNMEKLMETILDREPVPSSGVESSNYQKKISLIENATLDIKRRLYQLEDVIDDETIFCSEEELSQE